MRSSTRTAIRLWRDDPNRAGRPPGCLGFLWRDMPRILAVPVTSERATRRGGDSNLPAEVSVPAGEDLSSRMPLSPAHAAGHLKPISWTFEMSVDVIEMSVDVPAEVCAGCWNGEGPSRDIARSEP